MPLVCLSPDIYFDVPHSCDYQCDCSMVRSLPVQVTRENKFPQTHFGKTYLHCIVYTEENKARPLEDLIPAHEHCKYQIVALSVLDVQEETCHCK